MGTPIISQSFDNTLESVREMRAAYEDSLAAVNQALSQLADLDWTGDSRTAFNTVSEQWTDAITGELTRLSEYAFLTEQVVNEQRDKESQRATQAQSVQVGTATGGGTQVGTDGGGTQVGTAGSTPFGAQGLASPTIPGIPPA
ncbi:hypothetical protein [Streptomyces sp. NPDC058548]|uniref:hypothetical protein n=1 Tax=unclassified Streptomyces TaxID=2593676 RepID=UPI003651119C